MHVFISHISEEADLAIVLKEWIESSFSGQCEVFVSSDKDDLPPGTKWLEEIDKALDDASILLILCSPMSLSRSWINFETGCGWIKRVPIIPICHSHQAKGSLPAPISMFQALELEDDKFIDDLLSGLAKHLGFTKTPRIDQLRMKSDLLKAANSIELLDMPEEESSALKATEIEFKLTDEAIEVLKILSGLSTNNPRPTAIQLARHFNMNEQQMKYHLDLLYEEDYIHPHMYVNRDTEYSLNSNGRKFLFENGLL